jgi:hypothetical protein
MEGEGGSTEQNRFVLFEQPMAEQHLGLKLSQLLRCFSVTINVSLIKSSNLHRLADLHSPSILLYFRLGILSIFLLKSIAFVEFGSKFIRKYTRVIMVDFSIYSSCSYQSLT